MPKDQKLVRGQCRQVVKEMLTEEFKAALLSEVNKLVDNRLDAITAHLKASLEAIDARSKDVQGYLIRQTAQNTFISSDKN